MTDASEIYFVEFTIAGRKLHQEMTVPTGPTQPRELLPLFQSLADAVVDLSVKAMEDRGERLSCKKGCGACCRQLVPVTESEARRIGDLVQQLPEPRRSVIRQRFVDARQRLDAAGLLEPLLAPIRRSEGERQRLGLDYFEQHIACPFLEEESCSIYLDRPIRCREYLVTSPAENCARPTAETVKPIHIPLPIWNAAARLDDPGRWVPLSLAPEWAESHPQVTPPRPGPELLRAFMERVAPSAAPSDAGPQVVPS